MPEDNKTLDECPRSARCQLEIGDRLRSELDKMWTAINTTQTIAAKTLGIVETLADQRTSRKSMSSMIDLSAGKYHLKVAGSVAAIAVALVVGVVGWVYFEHQPSHQTK